MAQDRPGGFRGGGNNFGGLGIGLGIGAGAATLGAILSSQGRAAPPPEIIETGRGDGRIRTFHTGPRAYPSIGTPSTSHRRPQKPKPAMVAQAPLAPPLTFMVPARTETRYVPDEILVLTKGNISPARLQRLEATFGLTPLRSDRISLLGGDLRRYRLRPGSTVAATIGLLVSRRWIAAAEPNYRFDLQDDAAVAAANTTPLPAGEGSNAAAPVQYAVTALRLVDAHKVASGADVLVGLIDSGVDDTNPDVEGAIADRFDALGAPFIPMPHGTAMGGAIVAHHTLVGVAPKARLLAVRAFTGQQGANGTGDDILRRLDYVVAHGAKVVNMSFAGPRDALLGTALKATVAHGTVVIAAAGNGGPTAPPSYPGAEPDVIAVTAIDADEKPFVLANRGRYIAVAAPGVAVIAPGLGRSVQITSGTSIAAAEASGVAALILQRHPKASPDEVRRILTSTARPLTTEPSIGGAGAIDAGAAVALTD